MTCPISILTLPFASSASQALSFGTKNFIYTAFLIHLHSFVYRNHLFFGFRLKLSGNSFLHDIKVSNLFELVLNWNFDREISIHCLLHTAPLLFLITPGWENVNLEQPTWSHFEQCHQVSRKVNLWVPCQPYCYQYSTVSQHYPLVPHALLFFLCAEPFWSHSTSGQWIGQDEQRDTWFCAEQTGHILIVTETEYLYYNTQNYLLQTGRKYLVGRRDLRIKLILLIGAHHTTGAHERNGFCTTFAML